MYTLVEKLLLDVEFSNAHSLSMISKFYLSLKLNLHELELG